MLLYTSTYTKYNSHTMHIPLVIVIGIVVILGMIVDANAKARVHSEYTRRRWASSQNPAFNIFNELPTGVHHEYNKRRRQMLYNRYASAVKIHNEPTAKKYRQKSASNARHYVRN